jgi:hypothetical protein
MFIFIATNNYKFNLFFSALCSLNLKVVILSQTSVIGVIGQELLERKNLWKQFEEIRSSPIGKTS